MLTLGLDLNGPPARDPLTRFPLRDASALDRLIQAFERGRLPLSRWTHPMKLTLAVGYLWDLPEWDATERYLNLLRRYSRSDGAVSSEHQYHETIALFWLIVARHFVEPRRSDGDRLTTVNELVDRFGEMERELPRRYYTRATLRSWKARQTWVEPDRRSLDELLAEVE